jgi:hypothetical protein
MKEKLLYRSIIRYIAGDREGAVKLLEQAIQVGGGRLMVPIREIIRAKGEIA